MAKRIVITGPELPHHHQPIPVAVKIGQMVFSSALPGLDASTQSAPSEPEKQVELAFQHVRKVIELAGGTTEDIAKVVVYLEDMKYRELVNTDWVRMFPNENDRPIRHTVKADLPSNFIIQLEMTAVL